MKITYVCNNQPIPSLKKGKNDVVNSKQSSPQIFSANKKQICFMGVRPTPMLKTTYDGVKSVYDTYYKSLGEISLKDIINITNNIQNTTNHSRKEILGAMQVLTQFGNLKSVNSAAKVLSDKKISYIGFSKRTYDMRRMSSDVFDACRPKADLTRTLEYLIDKKGFGELKTDHRAKIAIFLDNSRLTRLETLKEKNPKKFNELKKNKKIKFFMLSGWDNGITFIDRTKDLETETRKLLELSDKTKLPPDLAINKSTFKRIKNLGLRPTVISRDGLPTEHTVYNQLAPEKMSQSELYNLVNSNAQTRSEDYLTQLKIKDESVKYLNENLKVFTPESLSKLSKKLHTRVLQHAQKKEILPENIIYVEFDELKSDTLVTHMYKNVNKLPDNQFIGLGDIHRNNVDLSDKMLVFLDDCSITGDTIKEKQNRTLRNINKKVPKLFVCLTSTLDAMDFFGKDKYTDILIGELVPSIPTSKRHLSSSKLERALGIASYMEGEATSLVLPYMSPDTNVEFASNIALLHNSNYRSSNIMIPRIKRNKDKVSEEGAYTIYKTYKHEGIKSYTMLADKIAKTANELAGTTPVVIDKDLKTIKSEMPKKPKNYFKLSTYIEMLNEIFESF